MHRKLKGVVTSKYLAWLDSMLWLPLRKLVYRHRIRESSHMGRTPVLVYSMGKVATSTMVASIKKYANIQPIHVHVLNPVQLQSRRIRSRHDEDRSSALEFWQAVHDMVIESDRNVKIVTLVREPIGRNISGFFQGLDRRFQVPRAHEQVDIQTLQKTFVNDYQHRRPLTWFDDELKATTGIDVYSRPFPKETGYLRVQEGRFGVLIMRHDLPDELKAGCLSDFLGISGMAIVRDNAAEGKAYRDCYREFQRTIRLGPGYIAEMLDSKYARHFFPATELEALRRKWLRIDERAVSA